jgi:hypothetical protein
MSIRFTVRDISARAGGMPGARDGMRPKTGRPQAFQTGGKRICSPRPMDLENAVSGRTSSSCMDSGSLRRKAVAEGHGPARQVVKIRTAKTRPKREI